MNLNKSLKQLIDSGDCPTISEDDAGEYSYKDVVELGYGIIQQLYMGNSNFEMWFTYSGPHSIIINDIVINHNEMIELLIAGFVDPYYEGIE